MALRAAGLSGLPWLAVDSGLCGEALGNEPGIFSARWAGPDRDFGLAMQLVWDNLPAKGPEAGHDAHFVCALALAVPDGHVEALDGRVDGLLISPPHGANGFGYDPISEPQGPHLSFGTTEQD